MVIVLRKKLLPGVALCVAAVIAIPLLCFGLSDQAQPQRRQYELGLSFPENRQNAPRPMRRWIS